MGIGRCESSHPPSLLNSREEGFSEIALLHDKVYAGPLEAYLHLDIPYIPNITIATIPDSNKVKMLCDELNGTDLAITGSLDGITIGHYDGSLMVLLCMILTL